MEDQNKNLILAVVLSAIVMIVWIAFFSPPPPVVDPNAPSELTTVDGQAVVPGVAAGEEAAVVSPTTEATATAQAARITIDTNRVIGSISTVGGRIDHLELRDYRETLDEDSPIVTLLKSSEDAQPYYALYGWAAGSGLTAETVPGQNTIWQQVGDNDLTPDTPITLSWDNGAGVVFNRTIAIDDEYMFSVTQTVQNNTATDIRAQPYGAILQKGQPDTVDIFILHEGLIRQNDDTLNEIDYDGMIDMDFVDTEGANADIVDVEENGWIGFTGKEWMTALIPAPGQKFTSVARYSEKRNLFQAQTRLPTMTIPAGQTVAVTTQLFAGAKKWETIRDYESAGIHNFLDAIDWGFLSFLTKPMFWLLYTINGFVGNMGWSILVLTLLIKAVLLPLAYKSYVSMAKMKALQPQMEEIKERAGDDKQKMQKDVMQLYKTEKVNPASGCLPILLQIPIFFSLYKVIFVTIELRHAAWFGWIQDLSAPDPSSILNLFGLLPYAIPDLGFLNLLSLGILPILLGISMWMQQKLNPAPTEPTQAMVMAWMPWVFMFMLGQFASGLVVYWIANNTITFTQQYLIMRSQGVKPDVLGNITSSFKRKKPSA